MALVIIPERLDNIMQFKINATDLDFIINIIDDLSVLNKLKKSKEHGEHLAKEKYPTGKYIINLSTDDVDCIVEQLSDFILISGVDSSGEINSTGMRIESIIDIFI
ncbi:TPA: hypothetical protein ACO3YK_004541 [Salmonella enterica subsp. enterica serovar Strathcona]|uniref:Uncharacterized protein n=1 Tax=Salmonella enterica subsp. enterica serovar Stanleyville TaxID=286782 RepID=A0A8E7R8M8_SALET|nr:hypothetical protein [Salmonella enterica]ECL1614014.1 hypothetical protein [Salmonella enterica subsp. enterica]EDC4164328.1 hypothetical protein [Salmonella enterica subsp. enterica serovar Strathcona]EJN2819285.1 hypothetical protein [Salmonella enterica subsp. enterica serovar Wimborne]EAO3344451.1 hypothetical protein [Salmonella enterica]EBG0576598.1 hypothetical protein [Salmonella enterica subsp. enterica serovar Stanleyville]